MTTETRRESAAETVREVLAATTGETERYVINPSETFLLALASVAAETRDVPPLRVLGRRDALRVLRTDFTAGSRVADLVADGSVTIREAALDDETPMLVAEDGIYALVLVADVTGTVVARPDELVAEVRETCAELWADADPYPLRLPGYDRLRESALTDLGEAFRDDLDTALTVADDLDDPDAFHPVRAVVAVAAHRELLHYDVSRWGEDCGLASTASFSRHKTDLEDAGLVDTEKVPVDMGRPRQRLLLTDEARDLVDTEGVAALIRRAIAV
ncbi:DUF5821 family protein [Halobaculum sp. MBLA0147]|uniref:transcriptional regulator TbsP domain-containing protein n=1 Tax=Halobaculum sp. MBLA0147 TaxID=3079934 RepID=UPI003524F823